MSKDPLYQTWGSESERSSIYEIGNMDGYDGMVHRTVGHGYREQTYINVEPNRSVRPQFGRSDYDAFRPGEAIPLRQQKIMQACGAAYDKVGIIRNIIDLMSDFGSQGLVLVHPNKQVEQFYRKWYRQIKGDDRSERFLNYLYRLGNPIVQRRTARINKKEEKLLRSAGNIIVDNPKVPKRYIPYRYDFINPSFIEVKTPQGVYGKPVHYLRISQNAAQSLLNPANSNTDFYNSVSDETRAKISSGERLIPIDYDNTFFYHYKKDDWQLWANPMIYAILDDIRMLEKMKLADLAALDGAISSVRLWTLGDFDQKIVPTRAGLDKVRDILASNVGGGTMDFVWGPELKFQESQSQVYKFLGSEKYQPVLTSIYAGLGIPPTLTGSSGASGGYTNNYVSLKTLIERLEYGRNVLASFWRQEIEYVRKAMGFKTPAEIHFDSIVLSDEAAEKNLLIQLVDRGILSDETLLERFREIPNIEKVRVKREEKSRSKDPNVPKKASPYHNPQHKEDMAKISMTKDTLDKTYLDKLGVPSKDVVKEDTSVNNRDSKNREVKDNGRPDFARDSEPRKRRRVLPRSGQASNQDLDDNMEHRREALVLWGIKSQEQISKVLTSIACEHYGKKNARALNKTELQELEHLKLCVFTSMKPFMTITNEYIKELLDRGNIPSQAYCKAVETRKNSFSEYNNRAPNMSELTHIYASAYASLNAFV